MMKAIIVLFATVLLFCSCASSNGIINSDEQTLRDENGINLLLLETEKGEHSGSHRFTPLYSYSYNDRTKSDSVSVLFNCLYSGNKGTKGKVTEDVRFGLLGTLYIYVDERKRISETEETRDNKSVFGPAGVLWLSSEGEGHALNVALWGTLWLRYEAKKHSTDAVLWGLLWKHRDSHEENVKQITPFFKYVKDYQKKKKIFRLFWLIDIPLGDLGPGEVTTYKSAYAD